MLTGKTNNDIRTDEEMHNLLKSRAHNPERGAAMPWCHGVFTDQFIFRAILARI